MVDFISEYLIKNGDTIAIIRKDLRKAIIKSLLSKEDFDKLDDSSNGNIYYKEITNMQIKKTA